RVVLVGPDGTIRAVNADNGATIWRPSP
ncbi:PQQ-binding-like beta-propeller repeat protein, partial [Rhodococcus hoagii]|nr:PQQ-binding-like beta-propeller repeat protein [Prescottella equi]